MPSRMLSVTGGRDEDAVACTMNRFSALPSLTWPSGGEDDRLVEAVELRLALGERAVHVGAGDLAARRDGVVVGPPPARHLRADAALGVDVLPERDGEDRDVGVEVVEAHADRLGALVDDRPDVHVLAQPVAPQELDRDLGELLGRLT